MFICFYIQALGRVVGKIGGFIVVDNKNVACFEFKGFAGRFSYNAKNTIASSHIAIF